MNACGYDEDDRNEYFYNKDKYYPQPQQQAAPYLKDFTSQYI